jgi:hypothetical protein
MANSSFFVPAAHNIHMKFKKLHIISGLVVGIVIIFNFLFTLRLFFTVAFPEREVREAVTEFFKNNLNKAVKCNEVFIDYNGNIILSDFDVSIASDFNDNISLIKCKRGVINLDFFDLIRGRIIIKGLEFYNTEITFPKKYGKSHIESLYQIVDLSKFIKKVRDTYNHLYIDFKSTSLNYRESLRNAQVSIGLYGINAKINIEKNSIAYYADGYIKRLKTESIHNGSFNCRGNYYARKADSSRAHIRIENFDLTYLNDYMADYKLGEISVSGGLSCDLEYGASGGGQSLKGRVETNSLTVADLANKFNVVSNENLNADIDIRRDTVLNRYTVPRLDLNDDVCSIAASGEYVNNKTEKKITVRYRTNIIDLSDLSQVLTPFYNIRYAGTLESSGTFNLDFKNNRAAGTKIGLTIHKFTLVHNEKGNDTAIIDESNMRAEVTESEIRISAALKPLDSDITMKSATRVTSWSPFKSDTSITLGSGKLNIRVLTNSVVYTLNRIFTIAYNSRKTRHISVPFLQSPAGEFLNNNRMELSVKFDRIFAGRAKKFSNLAFYLLLNRGVVLLDNFSLQGCDAAYRLSAQAYLKSDQPYIKLEGGVHNLDCGELFRGTNSSGFISGTADIDFRYELSAGTPSDILENSRGSLGFRIVNGVLKNTIFQNRMRQFLRKNGYPYDSIGTINFDSITLSVSQTGEKFWLSNFSFQGDSISWYGGGEYTYAGGLNGRVGLTVKGKDSSARIPVQAFGPLLSPCIDVSDKKESQKECF